jgi:hypothetical protein
LAELCKPAPKAQITEALVEQLSHLLLLVYPSCGIVKEVTIKGKTIIFMPPIRMEYDIRGQIRLCHIHSPFLSDASRPIRKKRASVCEDRPVKKST